ncbi:MAG TPA: hypothetical protein VJ651_14520 [Noviherbaspirillum sp.]|nr:hypothetical protein [Noviherbaspirillum sp.]
MTSAGGRLGLASKTTLQGGWPAWHAVCIMSGISARHKCRRKTEENAQFFLLFCEKLMTKPTKEQVRKWQQERIKSHAPPPDPMHIRRELGWGSCDFRHPKAGRSNASG